MKILVLGAGMLGVTTAYFLNKRGHSVTVIDRQRESAAECSFANGGQLSYCHAEPWSNPKSFRKAIIWMGKKDAPLLFHFRADLRMWTWAVRFLANCTDKRKFDHSETMLRLGLYSREVMHEVQDEEQLDFAYRKNGIMHIFGTQYNLDCFIRQSEFQAERGAPFEVLNREQCVAKEPALSHRAEDMVGGVYYPLDESGDIYRFTHALIGKCDRVDFQYDTTIVKLKSEGDKIVSVVTNKGDFEADMIVMAMGAYSSVYLRKVGIHVPIYPMKGYSISIPIDEGDTSVPKMSVTHQRDKIVYSHLGSVFRAAGTAEFAGYNHAVTPHRIEMLKHAVRENFPECTRVDEATEWACLRPSTPDGPPILGKTKYRNLVLNTGQGTLGWTQGVGSAKIVADIVEGKKPDINMNGLTVERYKCPVL